MSQKTELLLRVISDYQKFCDFDQSSSVHLSSQQGELSECELDMIAAAAQQPALHAHDQS